MALSQLSFLHPWLLVALLALPILWFLLRAIPQAPNRQMFPGYFFLKQIKNDDETPSRTPWYILLIRLLALAALIIALAEPVFNAPERQSGTGPVLIILDDGWPAADNWRLRRNTLETIAAELNDTNRVAWLLTTTPKRLGQELEALRGPLSATQLSELARIIDPVALAPDRLAALSPLTQITEQLGGAADIRWLSDGSFTGADIRERQFLRRLAQFGTITAYEPDGLSPVLIGVNYRADDLVAEVKLAIPAEVPYENNLSVLARDGRLLQQAPFVIPVGEDRASVTIDLPLTFRNDIGMVRLQNTRTAGAVQLADASTRRAQVGIATSTATLSGTLLDSRFYLEQALSPFALITTDTLGNLVATDATVIVLDDVGRLRANDSEALRDWVRNGGILIRFAGPTMADASQDGALLRDTALLPVELRGGGRAFGGALTWEDPQPLGGFAEESPFSDLVPDPEVEVRRQILARPGVDTAGNSWAFLADGTPLVTARADEKGLIVLFHVTAAPDWSDLPISGLFVEMLRRVTALSVTETARVDPNRSYVPRRVLNGFGQLEDAPDDAQPIRAAGAINGADPAHPAGLYGDASAPLAINALTRESQYTALSAIGAYDSVRTVGYQAQEIRSLMSWFLLLTLMLILADALITLQINGKLRPAPVAAVLFALFLLPPINIAEAQIRPPLDSKAIDSALYTRFAYVVTGDREVDEISRAGLQGLSDRLTQRTALEPAAPVGVNPSTDDLSVYPLIYWPVLSSTPTPSENTLIKLEAYMAGGGLIVFDTRDGDLQISAQLTDEGAALRRILEQMNVPPLEPLPTGHVLRRSFYLMDDLPGRSESGPVWVKARSATGNVNDGVTPIIIGGRDWASAWAVDNEGRALRSMGPGGFQKREMAVRAGINMAMVALTGNYKVDQLQAEALLDQIGRERDAP